MSERLVDPDERIITAEAVERLKQGDSMVFLPPTTDAAEVSQVQEFSRPKPVIDAAPRQRSVREQLDRTVIGRARK